MVSFKASMLLLKEDFNGVYWNSWFLIISGTAEDFNSTTILTPSLLDSSRISLIPSIVLLLTTSAILSKSFDLFCR